MAMDEQELKELAEFKEHLKTCSFRPKELWHLEQIEKIILQLENLQRENERLKEDYRLSCDNWNKRMDEKDTALSVYSKEITAKDAKIAELEAQQRTDALDGQATMDEAYNKINEQTETIKSMAAELVGEKARFRGLLITIANSSVASIGGLHNTYLPQLDKKKIDEWLSATKEGE